MKLLYVSGTLSTLLLYVTMETVVCVSRRHKYLQTLVKTWFEVETVLTICSWHGLGVTITITKLSFKKIISFPRFMLHSFLRIILHRTLYWRRYPDIKSNNSTTRYSDVKRLSCYCIGVWRKHFTAGHWPAETSSPVVLVLVPYTSLFFFRVRQVESLCNVVMT
jgi:hypothetical protein